MFRIEKIEDLWAIVRVRDNHPIIFAYSLNEARSIARVIKADYEQQEKESA